jgi:hypothetical protein
MPCRTSATLVAALTCDFARLTRSPRSTSRSFRFSPWMCWAVLGDSCNGHGLRIASGTQDDVDCRRSLRRCAQVKARSCQPELAFRAGKDPRRTLRSSPASASRERVSRDRPGEPLKSEGRRKGSPELAALLGPHCRPGHRLDMRCEDFRTRVDVAIFSRRAMWEFPCGAVDDSLLLKHW